MRFAQDPDYNCTAYIQKRLLLATTLISLFGQWSANRYVRNGWQLSRDQIPKEIKQARIGGESSSLFAYWIEVRYLFSNYFLNVSIYVFYQRIHFMSDSLVTNVSTPSYSVIHSIYYHIECATIKYLRERPATQFWKRSNQQQSPRSTETESDVCADWAEGYIQISHSGWTIAIILPSSVKPDIRMFQLGTFILPIYVQKTVIIKCMHCITAYYICNMSNKTVLSSIVIFSFCLHINILSPGKLSAETLRLNSERLATALDGKLIL